MSNEAVFENMLKRITAQMPPLANPAELPAQFVRDLHRQWKEGGGRVAGKPRHSDRYLEEQLKERGTRVKSLTPKLVGKTNIGSEDGAILVRFLLSNWPQPGLDEEHMQYKALGSKSEVETIGDYIEEQLRKTPGASAISPIAIGGSVDEELPGEPNSQLISRLFRECDVMITVAPEQVFVSAGPKTELIGFRDLIDLLRRVEAEDRRRRTLIWILDLGGPQLNDKSTRRKYLNVQQLIIRFKALIHYKDAEAEERLEWLKERAVIIVLDTYGDWRGSVNLARLPNFSSSHLSLSATTTEWMSSPNFRALYGSELEQERMRQRVFQVFFNASADWGSEPDNEEDLRYFGFASFKKSNDQVVGRGLELPALPSRYAEAFRAVCAAATDFLEMEPIDFKKEQVRAEDAKKQLSYIGYNVLDLTGFMEKY